MYKPPIELFIDPIESLIEKMAVERTRQIEKYVIEVLRVNGIIVDKERLERALINDKNQYYKGYVDGIREFAEKIVFEIINKPCEFKAVQTTPDFLTGLAHRQNEILDIIRDILHEMVGDNNG